MKTNERNWLYFAITAGLVAAGAAIVLWKFPRLHDMVWLALYTIPSHMFVSPFNHEWLLLLFAKSNPALWCTIASLIGCLIAGLWDYWLFIPLIHHPRLRRKYSRTAFYKRSVTLFRKSPFWALVIIGLTPIPFYPIKFLAISDRYPLKRYLAALAIGRTPRYYAIAYLGYVLKLPTWSLIVLALALLLFTFIQSRRGEKTSKEAKADAESTAGDRAAAYPAPTATGVSARSTPSGKS
ncbi:MAG: VTT domain-containing protein, partial [bacterium]